MLVTHTAPSCPFHPFWWPWLLQNSQNSLRKSLFTSRCSAAQCDRGAETRVHPRWLNHMLAMSLLLTWAQGPNHPGWFPLPQLHSSGKAAACTLLSLCSPSGRTNPGQGGLCTDTTPWATLRHYKYTGAIPRFRKTHSECKHFCKYCHWTSTHEVFCCFLHKS